VRMKELSQKLGEAMGRPSWMPVPGFVLETMLGDGAVVVLEGQQVLPKALIAKGFSYQHGAIASALKACI
jgi:uncharacterized protein